MTEAYFEPKVPFRETWGPSINGIETSLAIVTANLPALRPLLRTWFPRLFRSAASSESERRYAEGSTANERSLKMRDLSHRRPDDRCGSDSTTESQEQIFPSAGIRRTTDVSDPLHDEISKTGC